MPHSTLQSRWDRRTLSFDMPEVRSIESNGRQMIVVSSHGADAVVERAKTADAVVVDVVPINLRELFLGTVQDRK